MQIGPKRTGPIAKVIAGQNMQTRPIGFGSPTWKVLHKEMPTGPIADALANHKRQMGLCVLACKGFGNGTRLSGTRSYFVFTSLASFGTQTFFIFHRKFTGRPKH